MENKIIKTDKLLSELKEYNENWNTLASSLLQKPEHDPVEVVRYQKMGEGGTKLIAQLDLLLHVPSIATPVK